MEGDTDSSVDAESNKLTTQTASGDAGPPPDGGLQAWLTVFGCSLVAFSTFGLVLFLNSSFHIHLFLRIVNAYGAFNDFYRADYLSNYSPTLVSMIGSVGVFVLYACPWTSISP